MNRPALTVSDHERDAEIERLLGDIDRLVAEVNAVIDGFGPHAVRCTGEGSPLANLAASLALSQFRAMHALERAQKTNLASVAQVQPRNQRTSAPGSTPTDGGVSQSESDDGRSPSFLLKPDPCSHAASPVVGSSIFDPAAGASARKPDGNGPPPVATTPAAGSSSSCPRCVVGDDLLQRTLGPFLARELVGLRGRIERHLGVAP